MAIEEIGDDAAVVEETRTQGYESEEGEEAYYCATCSALITTGRERIEVDGGHQHTFVNPGGYIHRIGCFRRAAGCEVVGEPTNEFTWFAGHSWNYAVCGSCGSHLGWAYFRGAERRFFGLSLENLRRGG